MKSRGDVDPTREDRFVGMFCAAARSTLVASTRDACSVGGIGDLAHHVSRPELLPLNVSRTFRVRLRPRITQLTDRLPWGLIGACEKVTKAVVPVFSEKKAPVVAIWFDA